MSKKWHSKPIADVFFETRSKEIGLTKKEAARRFKKDGPNLLPQEKPYSKIQLFFSQFNNPLIYFLLIIVLISFVLKHYFDSIFIIIVLMINTTIGFYQEYRANESLSLLKKMMKIKARVFRNSNEREINSERLVVGDVIILRTGDRVPADGRIIKSKRLKMNEASLTGESQAVDKQAVDNLHKNTPISERTNMVFMGTIVEEGRALVVIVATGINTEMGKIVALLKETKERNTPFQRQINSLAKIAGLFILSVIFVIVVVGTLTGKPFTDIFVTALALAVSAIPEGLPPAITVVLVLGMRRIFNQNGLVKRLVAAETLGGVTVICTDKTGTLTEGKMQVSHVLTSTKELMGNDFDGFIKDENIEGAESYILALKIATLANDSYVENPEEELEQWIVRGRSTETALLLAGMHLGLNKKKLEKQYPILDRISFESENKFTATFHRIEKNKSALYVVGAPEEIIARSVNLDIDGRKVKLGTEEANKLIDKLEVLTKKGLRVLACAYRNYDAQTEYKNLIDLVDGLSLVGFIALKDPLRQDAKESILTTKKAGIRTVIVTGDHKLTAKTIAEEIGIAATKDKIIEGKELEIMSDEELREKSKYVTIYARVSPYHKLRIVRALQYNDEVVAMFGDGVNDAPALKTADIGVAVGSGTDVAKEVADLVLIDDNFKTILKAIEQGRVIFENIRKLFIYMVSDDFAELVLFLGCMVVGSPLPLIPAQILWINLVVNGFPDIALTAEQEIEGMMEEKPRDPKESMLNKPMKKWMTSLFFISGLAAFFFFFTLWKFTGDLGLAQTMTFVLLCLDPLVLVFSIRSLKKTMFRRDIFSNWYLTGAVIIALFLILVAVYIPPLQKILATQPLGISAWVTIICFSFIEILLIEFYKQKYFITNNQKVVIKKLKTWKDL